MTYGVWSANAKWEVDLEHEYMDPLPEVSPEDANDIASRVNDSIKRLESHIKIFRIAHESYIQKVKEYPTRGRNIWMLLWGFVTCILRSLKDESSMCCQVMIVFGLKSLFRILRPSYLWSFKLMIGKSLKPLLQPYPLYLLFQNQLSQILHESSLICYHLLTFPT